MKLDVLASGATDSKSIAFYLIGDVTESITLSLCHRRECGSHCGGSDLFYLL